MPLDVDDYANEGDNFLFRLIKSSQWDRVKNVVTATDFMAKQRDQFGNTALHAALGFRAPDSVLLPLIQVHPEACKLRGTDDWLPLHVAAMWGASPQVLEVLIRLYPQALDDPGEGGRRPKTPRYFASRFPQNRPLLERSTSEWMKIIQGNKTSAPKDNFQQMERRTKQRVA